MRQDFWGWCCVCRGQSEKTLWGCAGEGEAACGLLTEVHREMYTSAVTDVAFFRGAAAAVSRREHNYLSLFCADKLQVPPAVSPC